jgi:hypothetical protein
MSVTIRLWAFYELSADSTGATGLTVTVDVDKVAKANGAVTRVTTGGSAAEMANGVYSYAVANVADLDTYDYVGVFKTAATTVKSKHVPSLQQDLIAGLTTLLTLVDVAVSTRLAAASYSAAPEASAVADAVWDELISGHAIATSTGALLSSAGAAADPLLNAVPGTYASGSAGAALGRIGSASVTIVSPVADTGEISLVYGDDYLLADARALTFTGTNWPTITAGTIALIVSTPSAVVSVAGVVTGAAACYVPLTSTQVNSFGVGVWTYDLQVTLSNTHVVTLQQGTLMVTADVR